MKPKTFMPTNQRMAMLALLVLLLILLGVSSARAETIIGTFRYADENWVTGVTQLRPIAFAQVEIWVFRPRDFGIWAWGVEAFTTTDTNGSISVQMPFWEKGVKYGVQVFAVNYAARVYPDVLFPGWFQSEPGKPGPVINLEVQSASDVLDFTYDFTDPTISKHYNIAETIRHGFDYASVRRDVNAPGDKIDVLPPVNVQLTGITNSWYNYIFDTVVINNNHRFQDFLILHEYAHFLEDQLSSFAPIPSSHDGYIARDPLGYIIKSAEHAWMEGFADYFAQAVNLTLPPGTLTGTPETGTMGAGHLERPRPISAFPELSGFTPAEVEAHVGAFLWDLVDRLGDPSALPEAHDTIERRDRDIFEIFDNELDIFGTWPTVNDFIDAWNARFNENLQQFLMSASGYPTANANGPYEGYEGSAVNFNGTASSDSDGTIAKYEWDLDGDGQYNDATGANPSKTWGDDYSGTIGLKVTDNDGLTATASTTVLVRNVAPTALATNDGPKAEGTSVTVTASQTDPGADTFTYSFDWNNDGTYEIVDQTSPSAQYTWMANGTYTVGVRVKDDDGGIGATTTTVTILDLAPTAKFSWSPEPQNEGSAVQFTDQSTSYPDTIVSWNWDFGDGGASTQQNPSHTYQDSGTYPVSLTVTDNDGSSNTISHNMTIVNVPPVVEAGQNQTSNEGDMVSFSGSFTDPGLLDTHTIKWDFGDGSTTVGTLTPTHTYGDNGTYTVTLIVTDDDGGVGTDTLIVTVNNVAPTANAGPDQEFAVVGKPVNFQGSHTDPGWLDTHTYEWDFNGDGITDATGANVTHTFLTECSRDVKLTVRDDDGGVGTDTVRVNVWGYFFEGPLNHNKLYIKVKSKSFKFVVGSTGQIFSGVDRLMYFSGGRIIIRYYSSAFNLIASANTLTDFASVRLSSLFGYYSLYDPAGVE